MEYPDYYDDLYDDEEDLIEDPYIYSDYTEYDYEQVLYENDFLSQQISCLPVLLIAIGTIIALIWAFGKVGIPQTATKQGIASHVDTMNTGEGSIAPLFTKEVQYWSASIAQWSQQTGIDSNLIATVMQIESCGDPFAKSSAGAMGLFQVMPYHFESGEDPYKPTTNARRGLDYLKRALAARNDVVRLGFAGYNGGITGAKRPESQWAKETQRYVYWGTGIYQDAIAGKRTSERLDEWINRGGSSLCRQAAERLGINP